MRRVVPFIAACALVGVLAPAADAGLPLPAAQLSVSPNPATTDDEITIGNAAGDANTCEGGEVTYLVMKTDGEGPVAYDTTTPDENGDWSITIDPIPVAGDFTVSAECNGVDKGAENVPTALPDFEYDDVLLTVTQASASSSTTTAAPTTSAAAATATRPSFTG